MGCRTGHRIIHACMMETVTILTPTRNAGALLERTIHSIRSQYAIVQNRCRLEHIILDGASTDNTLAVVAKFPETICISEPDSGMYHALAKGFKHVSGQLMGYLNAGDILFPWAFDVLLEIFANHDVNWITGYTSLINERLQVTASWKPPRYRNEFILNGFYADEKYPFGIQQESTFWRRDLLTHVDCARLEKIRLAGDYFLWTEFAKQTALHSVMSPLGAFLIHENQLSRQRNIYNAEVEDCIRSANTKERFTRWWETKCNPIFKGLFWNWTLGQSQAKIFDYDHTANCWKTR